MYVNTAILALLVLPYIAIAPVCLYIISLKKKHNDELESLRKTPVESVELSAFLGDINTRGFSFVRVAPETIIMRSPRDL